MAARVPSLTDAVVAEILSRLPPHSIGRARAVCRSWNAIASDPTTVVNRALAARSPTVAAIIKDAGIGRIADGCRRPVDAVRVDRFRGAWYPGVGKKTRLSPRALGLGDMAISAESFRSWDGVLCARAFPRNPPPQHGAGADEYMLWNPLTNACAVVSAPSAAGQGWIIGGYAHPMTGRFHLLHSSDVAVPGNRGLLTPTTVRILAVAGPYTVIKFHLTQEVPLPESKTTTISMRGEEDHAASLRGNLHWLVLQPASAGKAAAAALLVFDTAREEFRLMAAPEPDPETARLRVVPGGKLCVLALTQQPPLALEVWVLDDSSDDTRRSWRLRETVRLEGSALGLSPRSFAVAVAVEVVEGVDEGEEVFIQSGRRMAAYSVGRKAWRNVSLLRSCAALLLHRESIVPPGVSFGNALRGFRSGRASAEPCSFWEIQRWDRSTLTSANVPLQWSVKSEPRTKINTMA
ncbi:unnamed protein product [Urochloa decumbens]|uniref:F-box domain-containing protein n=1 Tax=Urochloa decumbens TaxID=240449 RepID=A0ABC8Y8S1_9POAL